MKDRLEEKFKELDGKFDIEEPKMGHFDRFETSLSKQTIKQFKKKPKTWQWIAVAASLALFLWLSLGDYSSKQGLELADVSPKMEETQNFFIASIQDEVKQINLKRNDNNKQVIDDAMFQLEKLEKDYNQLTLELKSSNKDKRVIYAMVSNFQQRIEVLKFLLEQLEQIKQLKNNINETAI